VVESLVTLARDYNRTVVFTIHQPRSNIVALFDQLVLLAKGQVVYSGPFAKCQSYFEHIGFPCPSGFNIADYLSMCTIVLPSLLLTPCLVDLTMTASSDTPPQPGTQAASSNHSVHGGHGRFDEEQPIRHNNDSLAVPAASPGTSGRNEFELPKRRRSFLSQVPDFIKQALDGTTGASSSPTAAGVVEIHLDALVKSYKESSIAKAVHDDVATIAASNSHSINGEVNQTRDVAEESNVLRGRRRASWTTQFRILSGRAFKNLYRDPALLTAHYAASIAIASALTGSLLRWRPTSYPPSSHMWYPGIPCPQRHIGISEPPRFFLLLVGIIRIFLSIKFGPLCE
jgi:hypothetical protein